jgi:HSP20 family protein
MAEVTPTRWDPFRELSPFARLFEDLFNEQRARPEAFRSPAVDIDETDDAYELSAEIPGVARDDLSIEIQEGVLTLRGEKRARHEPGKTRKAHWTERSYGPFARSFRLPVDAEVDKVKASFEQGVLEITVPKRPESKPQTIAIRRPRRGLELARFVLLFRGGMWVRRSTQGPAGAVVLLALFTASGCATVPPDEALARADAAIEAAENAGAAVYAPLPLRKAKDELKAAQLAMEDERYIEARRGAEKAEVEAQLAAAETRRERSREAAEELSLSVEAVAGEVR